MKFKIFYLISGLLFITSFHTYSQCNIKNNHISYIKFDFNEFAKGGYILDENLIEKRVTKNTIIFSKGISTMGKVNEFVFYKKKYKYKKMNPTDFKNIRFDKITDIKETDKINIIEITENCNIYLYPNVEWKKKIYKE